MPGVCVGAEVWLRQSNCSMQGPSFLGPGNVGYLAAFLDSTVRAQTVDGIMLPVNELARENEHELD